MTTEMRSQITFFFFWSSCVFLSCAWKKSILSLEHSFKHWTGKRQLARGDYRENLQIVCHKRSFEPFVSGSCFRTRAVILVSVLFCFLDDDNVSLFTLLDQPTPFDTMVHSIKLHTLHRDMGWQTRPCIAFHPPLQIAPVCQHPGIA